CFEKRTPMRNGSASTTCLLVLLAQNLRVAVGFLRSPKIPLRWAFSGTPFFSLPNHQNLIE
ncbi:MAG: hypothetical protein IKK20_03180, partial [Clostridia bacterium]|nr:hypothetical protein [Clostridia bacterium]